ncbi:MAG: formylglycine-generating enzyme family protein [Paludibacteraceae bacterium]|nr:formylglycine-generating enzyme family protein [Paludibacteraceae bacterium]
MKKLLIILLSALSLTTVAQNEVKRVAILETVDRVGDVNLGVKNLLRQSITFGINRLSGYEGFNRVDMAQITGEQKFQRTGYVSDADIKKLGVMTGAAYVLIAEATMYDATHILVFANLVDVETGKVTNSSIPKVASVDPEEMYKDCAEVAKSLLGVSENKGKSPSPISGGYSHGSGQDFTEDAWGINMKMIWVEGGEFMMGCTSEQGGDCYDDEKNVRRVTVDGFYIGMLEVTQSQWEKVVGTSVSQQRNKANSGWSLYGVGQDYPMYYVSWDEAMEFCRLLSIQTGRTYTLPTEAQWEYAARGGKKADGTKYAGSNMIDVVAWYTDNSGGGTHPCGTKRANALGIYDMSGNVWEWCKDWYSSSYTSYETNNPTGASSGSARVSRGGSWDGNARYCRVAYRYYYSPGSRHHYLGFRVVLLP